MSWVESVSLLVGALRFLTRPPSCPRPPHNRRPFSFSAFDAYRQFYGRASDLSGAHAFLRERFDHGESVVFLAFDAGGQGVGFTQLYPSFSSTAMARIFVLNDLFVCASARQQQPTTPDPSARCG